MPKMIPSLSLLIGEARRTFMRFPLSLLCAIVGTIAMIAQFEHMDEAETSGILKVVLTCSLGLPLFFALACFVERKLTNKSLKTVVLVAGIAAVVGYYLSLTDDFVTVYTFNIRFVILELVAVCSVAFLGFLGTDETDGFWQFNKTLFLKVLFAALYAAVLFVGCAIALAALDKLFGASVPYQRYPQLWVIMAGIVAPWLFLAGVPENLPEMKSIGDYPRGLQIFAQYILLPLVALYLVILYVYEAKIIVTQTWPRGWVSSLILWYSVVGIFSLLLLWPLREQEENKWVRVFSRWFFRLQIPLIPMLFLAILERVRDYGITVNRYLVLSLAVGLAFVTLYFLFSRKKDIRVFSITLAVIGLLAAYGPQSAFSVGERSQQARLAGYLEKYDVRARGDRISPEKKVQFEDRVQMSSIVSYLVDWHGVGSMDRWLTDSTLSALTDTSNRAQYTRDLSVTEALGFDYAREWVRESGEIIGPHRVGSYEVTALDIHGYDYIHHLSITNSGENAEEKYFILGNNSCTVRLVWKSFRLRFELSDTTSAIVDTLNFNGSDTLNVDIEKYLIPYFGESDPEDWRGPIKVSFGEVGNYRLAVAIRDFTIETQDSSKTLHSLDVDVLFQKLK